MTKQVLFVQGAGDGAHDRWDDKLVESLERALGDCDVRYPRMPDEADPHYAVWKPALLGELAALDDGAILVGHSVGGTILIHVLAEQLPKARIGGVFLVAAPFIGEGGWPSDEIQPLPALSRRLADVPIFLYQGEADTTVPFAHLALYAKALSHATIRAVARGDHQLGNDLRIVARDIRSLG